MSYTVKGTWTPTIREALNVLICAIFRVEMTLDQTTDNIVYERKQNENRIRT